jgi:hypothetical protein
VPEESIPLFPLHTVLFPGGLLPLRIFEPRYLDMISRCLRTGSSFGVVLIRSGGEVGAPAVPHSIGTLADIVDWSSDPQGLLHIVARGGERFDIIETSVAPDKLLAATIRRYPPEEDCAIPPVYEFLAEILRDALASAPRSTIEANLASAQWVGWRLAELLPLENDERLSLLDARDPLARLRAIAAHIRI